MGADIKALRSRIKSVESTMHLTKAMGLVASSKLRNASISAENSKNYLNALLEATLSLSKKVTKRWPFSRKGGRKVV